MIVVYSTDGMMKRTFDFSDVQSTTFCIQDYGKLLKVTIEQVVPDA